jgi:erythromycin esterase-like protein
MKRRFLAVGLGLLALALPNCSPRSRGARPDGSASFEAVPLLGLDPRRSDGADLRAISKWIRGAHLVGLGEAVHGADQLHRLTHRLLAHLVEWDGFTVFALEVDAAHGMLLDDYVSGRRDDLDAILAQRWWASEIFYDLAIRDLIVWMREYNRTARTPIHIAGFDLKQPDLAMAILVKRLDAVDPDAAAEASAQFRAIRDLGGFGVFPNVAGYSADFEIPLPGAGALAQTLAVNLRLRSRGFSHGSAGFTLRAGDSNGDAVVRGDDPRLASVGGREGEGIPLGARLEVPPGTRSATLTVLHRGNGTVWFDGLSVLVGGRPVAVRLDQAEARALMMPRLQVMDYTAVADRAAGGDGGGSLRVDCDPRVDAAIAAANRISTIVEAVASAATSAPAETTWLRQLARLVVEASEWRGLVENNRDVFLAENLVWLGRRAYPQARVLALAHTVHTERRPARMGRFLAQAMGDDFRAISMIAVAGEYRYFATPGPDSSAADGLRVVEIGSRETSPYGRYLAALRAGDFIVRRPGRVPADVDGSSIPDIAILLRRVTPIRMPPPAP